MKIEKITREAIEAVAAEQNKTTIQLITELQTAAALLGSAGEATLDSLCAIKWEILEEKGLV